MAVYKDLLDQVVADIKALSLTGISDSNVVQLKVATDNERDLPALPGVIVVPFGSKTYKPATNTRHDVTYPVLIAAISASNRSQSSNLARQYGWDESIIGAFINKRFDGASVSSHDIRRADIDSDTPFDVPAWLKKLDATIIRLRFTSRESN